MSSGYHWCDLIPEIRNIAKKLLTKERIIAIMLLTVGGVHHMPPTEVVLFEEDDGTIPLLQWLDGLPAKVQDKCLVRIERLRDMGHELRRPEADFLRNGIHELRVSSQRVHYRILYFFSGKAAVISHGLKKERRVPEGDIELAIDRMMRFRG